MILPASNAPCLAHEPKNGPTCVLAVAVWLKLNRKYFNEGMAKEACNQFKVRAKQLSRVLTGRKYLGYTGKETQGHRDSDHHTRTSSPKKEGQHLKTTYNDDIQITVHMAKKQL